MLRTIRKMTSKIVKKQLLLNKKSANRGRKMIRKVTRKVVKRNEVYKVWDAYLKLFYEDLLAGKEVSGMANVGKFVIEKSKVSSSAKKLRLKGLVAKKGKLMPIRVLNLNNLDYAFKVNYYKGKSIVDGVKFYPCQRLKSKIFEIVSKGKDFRECQLTD